MESETMRMNLYSVILKYIWSFIQLGWILYARFYTFKSIGSLSFVGLPNIGTFHFTKYVFKKNPNSLKIPANS